MLQKNNQPNQPPKDKSKILFDLIADIYSKVGTEKMSDERNPYRELIWPKVKAGKVLEVGVGTGNNIRYHPDNIQITAIDYSGNMMKYAKQQATEQNKEIEFHLMDVQSLDFPDNTFDSAVITYVFCSVPTPIKGLKELDRVVKSGGDIWLLEHGRVDRPVVGKIMDILNPSIAFLSGENINREIDKLVLEVGLEVVDVLSFKDGLIKIVHAKAN